VTTLIIVSNPVLSHFSSTVFALSCVSAEVSASAQFSLFSSSELNNISIRDTTNFIGFKVNHALFHFIIFELDLAHCHCQSSSIGFRSI
jgi:hypothetical protein